MARIIDCSKCYHLQETAPDAGYCGHMHINPCYRGLHREPKVTPKVIEELPPLPPKHVMSNREKAGLAAMERKVRAVNPLGTGEILILRDTPVPPMREDRRKIDWSRYHDFVVKMNRAGCSAREIARKIGVSAESVNKYISSIVDEGVENLRPFHIRKYNFQEIPEVRVVAGTKTKKLKYDYQKHHEKIFGMIIRGASYAEIEDETDIPRDAIWRYVKMYAKSEEEKRCQK